MMYHSKFVTVIKANGKVLRENNGEVAIPFGSEYSILLKNMNSVRAQVRVSIDGVEATDGWLILQPNGKLDLERWIKNGNLSKGNKFKFIERTSKIENHRGIGEEDGLVRVEYKFEKVYQPTPKIIHEHHYNPWYPYYTWYPEPVIFKTIPSVPIWNNGYTTHTSNVQGGVISHTETTGGFNVSQTETYGSGDVQTMGIYNCSVGSTLGSTSEAAMRGLGELSKCTESNQMHQQCMTATSVPNNTGITVAGSESTQKFCTVPNFACQASDVIVLKLIGAIGETKIVNPITVDVKPKCVTCGRVNKATNKFCSECGTSLTII
jgi:hypothetical protein